MAQLERVWLKGCKHRTCSLDGISSQSIIAVHEPILFSTQINWIRAKIPNLIRGLNERFVSLCFSIADQTISFHTLSLWLQINNNLSGLLREIEKALLQQSYNYFWSHKPSFLQKFWLMVVSRCMQKERRSMQQLGTEQSPGLFQPATPKYYERPCKTMTETSPYSTMLWQTCCRPKPQQLEP